MKEINETHFPPLEYLKIVTYFKEDIARPDKFIASLIDVLSSAFGGSINLDRQVETSVIRTNAPGKENVKLWTFQPELGWYRHETHGVDVRSICNSAILEDYPMLLGQALFVQQGTRSPKYKAFDYVWKIKLEASESSESVQRDCLCQVAVSTHLFPDDHIGHIARKSSKFVDNIVDASLSHGQMYYALADASGFREDGAGWCYLGAGPSNWSSIKFRIEHELWEQAGIGRHEKVRGVYAAQYLSSKILDRLGGKSEFISELLKIRDRRSDLVTELSHGGIVLRLAPTPVDSCAFGTNQGFCEVATWLYKRFYKAGLLLH